MSSLALDPAVCERARLARDPRFDGRFFVAVRTTGIYCRPVCPVRLPKAENVRFYPSAAAAAEQGYRPCLRCRPELAPDNPWWPQQPPLVREALRRIGDGAVDDAGVGGLAARLGVSDRHLRRLFHEHVGASPRAVAQCRRLLFAKQLVSDTRLPLQQVAGAAGFGSVRRFNAAFRKLYGQAPSALRRVGEARPQGFVLRLGYRPPYHWPQLRDFLAGRAIPGVESVQGGVYRRSFLWLGRPGLLSLRPIDGEHAFRLEVQHAQPAALYSIAERCRRLLDLDAVPEEIGRRLGRDPRLAAILDAHPGLRLPGAWERFELCVRAVIGQQITIAAARTLLGRLVARCGETAPGLPQGWRLFPRPATLAAADLGGLGLTGRRIAALQELASAVDKGALDLDGDPQAVDRALVAIPGIGPWTRAYVAMRGLGHPDALPAGDIVLRKVLASGPGPLSPRELERQAESWRPWRAYAVITLWHGTTQGVQ